MISTLGLRLSRLFQRTAPDPFVIAIGLTVVTFVLAVVLTPSGPSDVANAWVGDWWNGGGDRGVWTLLAFGMQMCLILVTGHALASSPPVARLLGVLADTPRTPAHAVALVASIAMLLGVLNWGLGLVAGALLARRVAERCAARGIGVHYPLLAASGYLGMLVWHGGFSGSAPLKVTSEHEIQSIFGADAGFGAITLSQTVLSPTNLLVTGGLLVLMPVVMSLMHPRDAGEIRSVELFAGSAASSDRPPEKDDRAFLPRVLEESPIVTLALVGLIGWWAVQFYGRSNGLQRLDPNSVNLTMLMLGLVLHWRPISYVRAVEEAARGCAGIILQFPLYAGIMAMMSGSGLSARMAQALTDGAGPTTLPIATFLSAAAVNLFVPSGGGQWAVQGPIAMSAGAEIGVDPGRMVMSVAYGDQLTNMLQPFWALPLLAITGVKARDIVGYTAIAMVLAGVWMLVGLLVF